MLFLYKSNNTNSFYAKSNKNYSKLEIYFNSLTFFLRDLCTDLDITRGGLRSGFVFRNGKWRNYLGIIVDNPVKSTDVKEGTWLAIICNLDLNYGTFMMFPKETLAPPLCMYT